MSADLARIVAAVDASLGPRLDALVLLGSHARGEAGICMTDAGPRTENDYDLVAVGRGLDHARVAAVARAVSEEIGTEVDLWPLDPRRLRPAPRTLLWLDAALDGARVLRGDPAVLRSVRQLRPRDVPLDEGARLLVNRAVGLALSRLEGLPDSLRTRRHAHKAALGLGDAVLLAARRYAGRAEARLAELRRLVRAPAVGPELVEAYADALRFKLRPDRWDGAEPLVPWFERIARLVGRAHLALDTRRVGTPSDPAGYVRHTGWVFPTPSDVRAGVVTAARAAARGRLPWRLATKHPRETLARVAVGLAYGASDDAARRAVLELLGLPDAAGTVPAPGSAQHGFAPPGPQAERLRAALLGLAAWGG